MSSPIRRSLAGLVLVSVLIAGACSGAAPATPTPAVPTPTVPVTSAPPATATPTPAVTPVPTTPATPEPTASPTAPPTPSPAPTTDPTAWATEICDINADFLTGAQSVRRDIPEPTDRTLEAALAVHARRRPLIDKLTTDSMDRTRAVERIEGGDPFQDALAAEFEDQLKTSAAFYDAIASAKSRADIDQANFVQGTANQPFVADSARAVIAIPLPLADAIAFTQGCRFFEFDARARVRGFLTASFTKTVIDDSFDDAGVWKVGTFGGGEAAVASGKFAIRFDSGAGTHAVTTTTKHPQALFGDVRVEATYSVEPYSLSGLTCRSALGAYYSVQVNPLGLVLIYRWAGGQMIIGRRTSPKGAVAATEIQLAIECVGGHSNSEPLLIAVYLDGERVAEVVDPKPISKEGNVGMFAQTVGAPSTTSYDDITILVPAE